MTITLATTSAVDGQQMLVRIYDFSAVAQTITWVNTENSISVEAPTTSNGSTTLPTSARFIYNAATSKWRCFETGSVKTQSAGDNSTKVATTAYADLKLAKANNLSDVASAATALSNLGGQPGTSQRSVFTTAGAFSGTAPAWANSAIVYLVGGGGGGGGGAVSTTAFGGGGGAAAGTVVARSIPVTPGASYSGSVGAGGAGGAGGNGTRGTNTTLTTTGLLGIALTATGGQYGNVGQSGATAGGGIYGVASSSTGIAFSPGSGGLGTSSTTINSSGPIPFGASGGAGGYPSTVTGTVGGKGGGGGSTTTGASGNGANTGFTTGTDGTAGESSSSTSPGGGGGGGGGAAYSGTPGSGGAGGTGSVVIIWQAS